MGKGLLGSALPLDGGRGYVVTTVIQCGTAQQADAVKRAVEIALHKIVPEAYAVSPDMAAAMVRDQHHAVEAPMPPIFDDEPPLRACPNGGCGE